MGRTNIQVRLSDYGIEHLDKVADETGVTRSDVFRCAMAVALAHRAELVKVILEAKDRP